MWTEARLHFVEEPLLPDHLPGYSRLCAEVQGTKIASGEHEATLYGFAGLLRDRAAHILQPDVTWSGGLTECRRISMAAETSGIPVIPHRGSSVYGMTLIVTSRSHKTLAESFGTGDSGNELMELLTPRLEKGHYVLPRGWDLVWISHRTCSRSLRPDWYRLTFGRCGTDMELPGSCRLRAGARSCGLEGPHASA